MRSLVKGTWALGLLALACSGGAEDLSVDDLGQSEDAVVRATSQGGRNEAIMLRITYTFNQDGQTYIGHRTCSGSYFAPRVVLTAAHCLEGTFLNEVLVYFGDNVPQDEGQLTHIGDTTYPPAPGKPSNWAKADSFELNPAWEPNLVRADMAVVYLDRKLPFDPLPLGRFNLDSTWLNKPATFSGWGGDTVTSPFTSTGSGVQRTGKTVIKGTPTAADYHADDPNPGMLNAAVRATVVKTDGKGTNSNVCFGDSGGPLFVNKSGQDYIVGVGYWTGLSCADYTLWTRIDPYLPFLDNAYKRGGQDTLIPRLDCVSPNADGSYTAFFGYNNKNGVSINVPTGTKNSLAADSLNTRPTLFAPGDHSFSFGVKFAANQTLSYKLSPDNSPTTTLTVNKNSPKCGANQARQALCGNACVAEQKAGCPTPVPFESCLQDCNSLYDFVDSFNPACVPQANAVWACTGATPAGTSNWDCVDESLPSSKSCGGQYTELFSCLGF